MKHIIKSIFVLFAILISSCQKDWLDVKTNSKLSVPKNLADFQALLDFDDVMNDFSPTLGEIAQGNHYVPDQSLEFLTPIEINAYTWSHEHPNVTVIEWNRTYE